MCYGTYVTTNPKHRHTVHPETVFYLLLLQLLPDDDLVCLYYCIVCFVH